MGNIPSLVIFDCDGVLVDSERLANQVMVAHIKNASGWDISEDESRVTFIGKRMSDVIDIVEAKSGRKLPADWLERFEADRDVVFTDRLKPVAGVESVLQRLQKENIPFCVASSGSIAKMHHSLGITGLLPLLKDRLFSTTEVPRGKPFPDIFLHAAARMGHTAETCVVIEDTPTGAEGARAAGMRCFGYAADADSQALEARGATCFTDMAALPALLGLS